MNSKKLWPVALLFIAVFFTGCAGNVPASQQAITPAEQAKTVDKGPNPAPKQEKMNVTVYFATKDARFLVPEVHEVVKTSQPAQAAIENLLAGPKNSELVSAIPAGTKLRGLSVKDHIAYVDFNEVIAKNNAGGSATEILIVGAIVNTLTEFSDIHKVQFMVNGKNIDTLTGHLDLSEPVSRSERMIKK